MTIKTERIYPCGICQAPVSWSCKGICCDGCEIWFHHECVEVTSAEYIDLGDTSAPWNCPRCHSLTSASFTFIEETTQNDTCLITLESPFQPPYTSSPKYDPNDCEAVNIGNTSSKIDPQSESRLHQSLIDSTIKNKSSNQIRTMTINCQHIGSKKQEFAVVIDQTKPDVIFGTESWLSGIRPGSPPTHDAIKSSEVFPEEYTPYRNDRNLNGGGVFILIKKSLISSEEPQFVTECEIDWVKLKLQNNKDLHLGVFYSPHRQPKDFVELKSSLSKLTANGKQSKNIILAGDFNCPHINWQENEVGSSGKDREAQQSLLDIAEKFNLTQIQKSPTRESNILDLVFTSNPSLICKSITIPGISDHNIIVTDMKIKPERTKQATRTSLKYRKANWPEMESDLEAIKREVKSGKHEGKDVEHLWSTFKNGLNNSIEKNIETVQIKPSSSLPWLNPALKKMLRKKKKLYKKAKVSKDWSKLREYQKICRNELRRAEWNYINGKIEEGLQNNNSKPFWRYIKAKNQDQMGVAPLRKNDQLESDSQIKADILLDQFKSVFTPQRPMNDVSLPPPKEDLKCITPIKIDEKGVTKLLQNLNPNKSSGPDNIPNRVLKHLAEPISPILTEIFQTSLDTGRLPSDWLSANIACAFKKGDRHAPENYRPISLTSVCCKLLEHIICHHIMTHLEKEKILTNLNHGFRSGYSTETQLLTTTNDLLKSFDEGKQVDMAILDFSKAFDTVPHDHLLMKMEYYGITGTLLKWLTCFLKERTMRVVIEGSKSRYASVDSGVPQGTVLGPLLFLCHINDLPEAVNSQTRLFADDCLVYREINRPDDHSELQEDLSSLERWAEKWGMRFNATKCYIMSIAKKKTSTHPYSLNNTILQHVTSNPYLGIKFSSDLKWSKHIAAISKKANATMGFIRRNLKHCPKSCRKNAYLALVRPILEYAAIVWDPHLQQEIDMLERVQRKAARFIANDYSTKTPGFVSNILEKEKLPPLKDRRMNQRLIFLHKIVENKLPSMPPENFTSPQRPARKIKTTKGDQMKSGNLMRKYQRNNEKCLKIPRANTPQYRNSFFPKTIPEWNSLSDRTISQPNPEKFKTALIEELRLQ